MKLVTDQDLLKRITPEHCKSAIHLAKTRSPRRYAHNILSELCGVPIRVAKAALELEEIFNG